MSSNGLDEKELKFMEGLAKLTRETGVQIAGCGCCGSPFLMEAEEPGNPDAGYTVDDAGDHVRWRTPGARTVHPNSALFFR